MNQLSQAHEVRYPAVGDFLIDRKYLFEVGGKGKTFDQIKDIDNSFWAVDNTEIGHKNRIPLWMFGLLY
jgi:phage antirepressor YoqD-like protein